MKNLTSFLINSFKQYPQNKCVYSNEKYFTYEQMYYRIKDLAFVLKNEYAIKPGDKIALYMDNSAEYIISYFAILWNNAIVVPINNVLSTDNINYIISEVQAKLIITNPKQRIKLKGIDIPIYDYNILDNIKYNAAYNDFKEEVQEPLALILFTSGTSAKPKGVMLTHHNLMFNTNSILDYLKLTSNSSIMSILSFTYSYGNSILLTHIKSGAFIYICNTSAFPQKVLQLLKENQFTGFSTVGSYFNLLLKQENFEYNCFENMNYITFAGESTSFNHLIEIQEHLPQLKLFVMYGQTEASARLSYLAPEQLKVKINSVGKPIKGVEIKIVDELLNEVLSGQIGEIIAKGDNIMEGYLNDPELTARTIKSEWLLTGDLGYMDEDGYIYIKGRKKDIIKYKGYRISPIEIEEELNKCNNIIESAVIESQDVNNDTIIMAFVVLKDMGQGLKDVQATLRTKLPSYKRPQEFEIISQLPKTSTGKIQREQLRKKEG